jgi:hypothetical protein
MRLHKFTRTTTFTSHAHHGFIAPVSLHEGLQRTLQTEFLNPQPHRVFHTE